MRISELKIEEPFKSLFRIDDHILSAIRKNIKTNGFDNSQPIIIWQGKNIVIDGHTRLQAMDEIGFGHIPVHEHSFKDENEALEFAIHKQRDRRNLSDGDILHLVEKLDQLLPRGGDRKSIFGFPKIDDSYKTLTLSEREIAIREGFRSRMRDSRDRTAELIGISTDKVSQCRHIMNNCNKHEINEITNGEVSIHQLYRRSLLAKQNEKKKIVQQDKEMKVIMELKSTDFPEGKHYEENVEKLDHLVLKLLPKINKIEQEMYEIMQAVEYFKSQGNAVFNIFCNKEPIQQFLGNLVATDFINIMRLFGYKIEKPFDLKVIEQKRIPKVDRRKYNMPIFNISRVNEPGFISNKEHKERDDYYGRMAERDLKKQ